MGRAGNSSFFLLPVVLSAPVGFNFLLDTGFCSLVVAVGSLAKGLRMFYEIWSMSRSVSCRKERLQNAWPPVLEVRPEGHPRTSCLGYANFILVLFKMMMVRV
ncbi:hypothetical protein KY285_024001 [Solanum tuberosum]|nr:hypothetical protein KY285_024001 [Solanum tuberosum]